MVGQARVSNSFAALRDVDEDGGEDELAAGIGNEVAKRHLRKFQEEQVATMIPEGNEQLPSHSLASVPHDATPVLIAEVSPRNRTASSAECQEETSRWGIKSRNS